MYCHAKVGAHLGVPHDAQHGDADTGQLLEGHLIAKEHAAAHEDDDRLDVAHHVVGQ